MIPIIHQISNMSRLCTDCHAADGSTENYSSGHIKKYVKETYNKDQGLLYKSEDAARAMVEEWKSTIAQEGDTYNEVINISPQPQAPLL